MGHALTILAVVAVIGPAPASAYSLLGGSTLGVRDSALHVQLGYPDLTVRYHIPVLEGIELIPRVGFHYTSSFLAGDLTPGVVGNSLGTDIKVHLMDRDKFHLSAYW